MMQRVVAVLTQAGEMAKAWEEDPDRDDLDAQKAMSAEMISEVLSLDTVVVGDPSPQAVANAVVQAMQPRIGELVGCFIAAFSRLARHHDEGDSSISSADMLQRMALEWELDDDSN